MSSFALHSRIDEKRAANAKRSIFRGKPDCGCHRDTQKALIRTNQGFS
jgi:hypothetical protein